MRITTLKYYKANGKSIQKIGVNPSVIFPQEIKENREIINPNILENDEVKSIAINIDKSKNNFEKIINTSQARISSNEYFEYMKNLKKGDYEFESKSLNPEKFKKELFDFLTKRNNAPELKTNSDLTFFSTSADVKLFKRKEYLLQKRKDWYQNLSKDFQIQEGLNILEDMNFLK
jgi:C-terminal domain of tail specific protease (DUF3340)